MWFPEHVQLGNDTCSDINSTHIPKLHCIRKLTRIKEEMHLACKLTSSADPMPVFLNFSIFMIQVQMNRMQMLLKTLNPISFYNIFESVFMEIQFNTTLRAG